jgi:gas vesicle protein
VKENGNGNGSLTGFVVGAIVGAAVGAGVALLVAPRTGKQARNWLARSTREIKDRATSAFEQAKETVQRETKGIAGQAALASPMRSSSTATR